MSLQRSNLGAPDVGTPLNIQLDYLQQLVKSLLRAEQFLYWSNVWMLAVQVAARKMYLNRRWFYILQGTASASAVTIPALVGLNLSGTGGLTMRWLSFAIGLVGAVGAAALQLFRPGSRWRMNRQYYAHLIRLGRDFSTRTAGADYCAPEEWEAFEAKVEAIIERYNSQYDSEVITPTQPGGMRG